jgi:prophage regulatory protein
MGDPHHSPPRIVHNALRHNVFVHFTILTSRLRLQIMSTTKHPGTPCNRGLDVSSKETNVEASPLCINFENLEKVTGLSRTSLWRRVKDGTFPAPIRLGPNRVAWNMDEVRAWLDNRPRVRYGTGDKQQEVMPS